MTKSAFHDIIDDPAEAARLTLRADLMDAIRQIIAEEKWTQTEAGRVLGVTQSRVSDLVNGRFDKFSLDTLVSFLGKLGRNVTVKVKKQAA